MKQTALAGLVLAVFACGGMAGVAPSATGSPSFSAASTKAADLRVRLDLLLAEQVTVIGKETVAAVNHTDEFGGYTTLLGTNAHDLAGVAGSAFGDTAGAQLLQAWNQEDADITDYVIGVVTHDRIKAGRALNHLLTASLPELAQMVASLARLRADQVIEPMHNGLTAIKEMIDDAFAQSYSLVYSDLRNASTSGTQVGDLLASQIAQQFPDKFPGDPSAAAVDVRVSLSVALETHAYLLSMATDAAAAGRTADLNAANAALKSNTESMASLLKTVDASQLNSIWLSRNAAALAYASTGSASSKRALSDDFVSRFSALTHTPSLPLTDQVAATIKVIDDQRARSYGVLPADDRAAATAMQPVADAIAG